MSEDNITERHVEIDYTNYRGDRATRRLLPMVMFFGDNKFHKGAQWFLEAIDIDKQPNAIRHFALKDIHSWKTK
jgi:hypothetical protein